MIIVIDNYDSFTYNLVQLVGELLMREFGMSRAAAEAGIAVIRNDRATAEDVAAAAPTHVIISPGPGSPPDSGVSLPLLRLLAGRVPILGVCLGHQCLAAVFAANVVRAERIMHGKTSRIRHSGRGVFAGLPDGFEACRYHSLIVCRDSLPAELEVTAWTDEGEIMGLRHRQLPLEGVQFHPESFLTTHGRALMLNFIAMSPRA
ncbi:MAG: aminodeoxychorismate/anthranilate synthase component II [Phycisphaerae bacterium]|nr:aminodeoxychorismate/anthranilate synthase component II [Phycisphaerae bacterium]NUQ44936.1 aminodeoxychorismate/anthranilate synthase component II [Phycisphaerae bacterium]